MATLEKRVQALEKENAARKKTEELLTIVVRTLASKEAFEKLQETVEESHEQYDKLFGVLTNHDAFTNTRLGDIQGQIIEIDGKIVGHQTETRQRFAELDGKVVGLQTEMRQRFAEQDSKIAALDGKVTALDGKVTALDGKVTALDGKVTALDGKIAEQQTETRQRLAGIETALTQILERLPEKP